jgi:peptide/nickel transport system permease protein
VKRRFHPGVALAVVFLLVLACGPWLAPHDPELVSLATRLRPPSADHWLGTDHLGRDTLSRILTGGQTTVGLSALALAFSIAIGVPVGLLGGYRGGSLDWGLMRGVDSFMALPEYVVAIVISGLLGPGFLNLLLAIVVVKWVGYTRLTRSIVLQEKAKDYLMVARLSGATAPAIMGRHLLPHVLGPVLALATLDIGKVILLVASLSYIGLGVQPPAPEWGAMLNDARVYFVQAPWLMVIPGVAIFLVVMTANWLGDRLARRYDVEVSDGRLADAVTP